MASTTTTWSKMKLETEKKDGKMVRTSWLKTKLAEGPRKLGMTWKLDNQPKSHTWEVGNL